jgi:CRISPR-associated protein Csx17
MNVIQLSGCTAEPLGSYLKGLSVLRLVAEQADAGARGWWDRTGFCIETELDEDALVDFFLTRYAPTPILSPWNGGSGFYPKDRRVGLDAITNSDAKRFGVYRRTIEQARQIVEEIGREKAGSKAEEDGRRMGIQLACRNRLPDPCVEWLDAAVGISAKDERTFAPILGTGGNEGRLDYTNNFMEYVAELLISPDGKIPVEELLRNSLFGTSTNGFQPSAVGQYDPGRAGGFNQGQGVDTADFPSNAWNFVLTLEGAVCWAAGMYRRQGVACRSFLCSPFTVKAAAVGYGTAATKDAEAARAEIWAPIWERPATYREIRTLLREGRASVDGKPARNGLEFAQAACLLGVDRGIAGFVRYNLLKRRGDSYVALPTGRFDVRYVSGRDLVRQLNPVLEAIDSQVKQPPAEFASLRRQVDEAMFNALLREGEEPLEDLAAAVGRLHRRLLLTGRELRIPADLTRDWIANLPQRAEMRIAAALAGIWDRDAGGMLAHLKRANGTFTWSGATLAERLARTLERRIQLAEKLGLNRNPLGSSYRATAWDASAFIEEQVDDERIEELLFAFTLIDWRDGDVGRVSAQDNLDAWPVYALLKHLFLTEEVATEDGGKRLIGDLSVLAALTSSDVESVDRACRIASHRLQNAGIVRAEITDAGGFDGMRLAAALLIPVPYGAAIKRFFEAKSGEER